MAIQSLALFFEKFIVFFLRFKQITVPLRHIHY